VASLRAQSWVHALLFLLYINDLPECLGSTTPCMYGNDTQIFLSSDDANKLVIKLNSDLVYVRNWLIEAPLLEGMLIRLITISEIVLQI